MHEGPSHHSARSRLRILSLDDEPCDAELIQSTLRIAGIDFDFQHVTTEAQYVEALETGQFDLVLADYSLPETDGITALRLCRERQPHWPLIFVSGSLGEEVAIETLKHGAADYVLKDRLERLPMAVERAVREARERAARRAAEESLRESQERYRALFDRSLDWVFLTDFHGKFLDANQVALDLLGFQREEMLALTFASLLTEDQFLLAEQVIEEIRAAGRQKQSTEFRLRRKTGGYILVETQSSLIYREGKPFAIQGIARDITERRRSEDRIRQQAALLEATHDAVLVCDLARGIQFMNPAAEALTGMTFVEAQSQELIAVLRARREIDLRAAFQDVTVRREWTGELELLTRDGKCRNVASRWTSLADAQGNACSILITCNDITEKKQLEIQYLRAQRLESIGTLASGVAHDLNNILSPIIMGMDLLKKEGADPQTTTVLAMMQESACRGSEIVKQLLTFARGAEAKQGPVQPRHLVREIVRLIRETFPKNLQIYTDYAQEPGTVLADPSQLHQVLMNLCVNARDAMPDGGVLLITLENLTLDASCVTLHPKARPIPYVVFKVADSGIGIPPEILDRIFDPFFTTKPQGKGTGLGLATVLGIVQSHEGFVLVDSQPGQGTIFRVHIPAAATAEVSAEKPKDIESFNGHGETILLVDDEPAILRMAENVLRRAGYETLACTHTSEAVHLYERNYDRIRAVVTDIMMPFADGRQLITLLYENNPQLPIIAMSGMMSEEFQRETMTRGACAFLAKPFDAEELLSVLHRVIHSHPASSN